MKKTPTLIILLLLFVYTTKAQVKMTGIYKSADDFVNERITHQGQHTKLKTHELFKRELFEVKTGDSTFSYQKKDLFGYVDHGKSYRLVNNTAYPILNPAEKILLYSLTSGTGTKNSPQVVTYYFSKDASSPIQLLTLRNVETVFAGEKQFEKLIEIHFVKDSDLLEYDSLHKQYKLNRLYELSKTP